MKRIEVRLQGSRPSKIKEKGVFSVPWSEQMVNFPRRKSVRMQYTPC